MHLARIEFSGIISLRWPLAKVTFEVPIIGAYHCKELSLKEARGKLFVLGHLPGSQNKLNAQLKTCNT